MAQAIDGGERCRDPAAGKRLTALDGECAALHPGVPVERGGVHVHRRREGDQVTVAVVSGEGLRARRDDGPAASAGVYGRLPGRGTAVPARRPARSAAAR